MLISVVKSNKVWTSPDAKISIWDIEDADGQKWQTRSQKIADSIGQTLDCTTTVSKSNKTYLVQTPRDGSQGSPGFTQATEGHVPGSSGTNATERFERAVERFERAVNKLLGESEPPTPAAAPPKDVVPKTINEQELADFFGGEIVDDIN